jgi:two-component system, chemotaxis family, sensor kinase CheA
MQIDMKRFHAAFFDESAEHLAAMEEALLQLERTPDDGELLPRIFRAAHSIKGASGTFGFADIATFTHGLEGLLDRMRNGQIAATSDLVGLLLRSADALGGLLAAAKDGSPLPGEVESLVVALEAAKNGTATAVTQALPHPHVTPAPASELHHYQVTFRPGPDLLRNGMDPLLLLRDIAAIGEILTLSVDDLRLPELADMLPDECYLGWTFGLKSAKSADEIRAVFLFVEDTSQISVEMAAATSKSAEPGAGQSAETAPACAAPEGAAPCAEPRRAAVAQSVQPCPPPRAQSRSLESSSIRVSVEKVDELLNLVGELVISQSMVNEVVGQAPPELLQAMQEALTTMNRATRDLQDRVMAVRMVPLASVFRRFPRVVHDLSATLGKQIHVDIRGEDTELDKQMIEQITDPLTHLVRNAVDHGMEMPDERLRAGKPVEGKLGLRAYQEGGNVVIEVSDDGRGLDRERIRRKAVGLGLVAGDESLSDEQIHAMILAPGFSTAEKVSDVSGRGVGMDVVKRNIEALNGSLAIESIAGRGTTFQIRLPLTLAIVDGLAAGLNGEIYILPLLSVVESLQPKAHELKSIAGKGEMIVIRGKPLPLIRLHRLFHADAGITDPTRGLVIIVENRGKRLGLLVDELIGQMQVVMKSLEANYQKVEGISAATILGDGQVAFILDVPGLARMALV